MSFVFAVWPRLEVLLVSPADFRIREEVVCLTATARRRKGRSEKIGPKGMIDPKVRSLLLLRQSCLVNLRNLYALQPIRSIGQSWKILRRKRGYSDQSHRSETTDHVKLGERESK
ncbi:hypothetical protein [Novipirellula caenicola]|uniref:hypothetical protein n=1 Tax=Novipirellula caenicola TaxID=1536901 RepID=UPI0031E639FE